VAGGRIDVCGRHGINSATFCKWQVRIRDVEVSDLRQLKALEDENTKLKKLLAARCSTTPCSRTSRQKTDGRCQREAVA
jgi:putative transposase